ncbi:MAG: hypothetical protein FJY85_19295 [Deltaproteobacteria bacterium]|nr:hypothetical protein [Deltaproteobacteria bacterium]
MDINTAKALIDRLIQSISTEINDIKSQVAGDIVMQVAIYSHDHIGADRAAFGVLSESGSLDREHLHELHRLQAVLLDREQRRNALKHLRHLLDDRNDEAMRLLDRELQRSFSQDEGYAFVLEPGLEYPNEYVKAYPYSD